MKAVGSRCRPFHLICPSCPQEDLSHDHALDRSSVPLTPTTGIADVLPDFPTDHGVFLCDDRSVVDLEPDPPALASLAGDVIVVAHCRSRSVSIRVERPSALGSDSLLSTSRSTIGAPVDWRATGKPMQDLLIEKRSVRSGRVVLDRPARLRGNLEKAIDVLLRFLDKILRREEPPCRISLPEELV